jgi:branched-subunit amino acid ABC-type transport system permease component
VPETDDRRGGLDVPFVVVVTGLIGSFWGSVIGGLLIGLARR